MLAAGSLTEMPTCLDSFDVKGPPQQSPQVLYPVASGTSESIVMGPEKQVDRRQGPDVGGVHGRGVIEITIPGGETNI